MSMIFEERCCKPFWPFMRSSQPFWCCIPFSIPFLIVLQTKFKSYLNIPTFPIAYTITEVLQLCDIWGISIVKPTRCTIFSNLFYFGITLYMFRTVFPSIVRSSRLYIQQQVYRLSQEECARLRESVPYVKVYRYNPKHLYPRLNGYGDNGQILLKLWQLLHTYWLPNTY